MELAPTISSTSLPSVKKLISRKNPNILPCTYHCPISAILETLVRLGPFYNHPWTLHISGNVSADNIFACLLLLLDIRLIFGSLVTSYRSFPIEIVAFFHMFFYCILVLFMLLWILFCP